MNTPGFGSVTFVGLRCPVTRIGFDHLRDELAGRRATTWAGCQAWSSNSASVQPGISRRASYSSPSYSLLATIGPSVVSFHDPSLTISVALSVRVIHDQLQQQFRIAVAGHIRRCARRAARRSVRYRARRRSHCRPDESAT